MTVFWKSTLVLAVLIAINTRPLHAEHSVSSAVGTVYHDINKDGSMTPNELLSGVVVELFEDDGDGIFELDVDSMLETDITDANGQYAFSRLEMNSQYFVHQTAQEVGAMNIQDSVTSLITVGFFKLMIDDFDSQQQVGANPRVPTGVSNLTSDSVLGGQRDLHVEFLSGPAEAMLYSNPYGLSSVLEFDQSAGVQAIATVTWDGIDEDMSTTPAIGGLGGVDITRDGSEAFAFSLGIDAAGAGEQLTMRVFSGNEVSTATIDWPVTNGTATVIQIVPYDAFSGDADFSKVDAIQLSLGGTNPSIDAQIGPIGTIGPVVNDIPVNIPEPSTILMSLLALVWFGARRKHRQCTTASQR